MFDAWGPEWKRHLYQEWRKALGVDGTEHGESEGLFMLRSLDEPVRNELLRHIPEGSTFLGGGVSATAFLSPDGKDVYKITAINQERDRKKDPPELLQPVWVKRFGPNIWLAKYQRARTIKDKDLSKAEQQKIHEYTEQVTKKYYPGYEPGGLGIKGRGDFGPEQVGLVDDQGRVIDEDTLPKVRFTK